MDMQRYLDLFLAESREHLGAAFEARSKLETEGSTAVLWGELFRHAHSLKGMAATMNYASMVTLAHALEDLLELLQQRDPAETPDCLGLLGESLACLGQIVDRIEHGEDPTSSKAEELAGRLRNQAETFEIVVESVIADDDPPVATLQSETLSEPVAVDPDETAWMMDISLAQELARSARGTVDVIRRISTLGRLVHAHPPLLTLRSGRFEGRLRLAIATSRSRDELSARLGAIRGVNRFSLDGISAGSSGDANRQEPTRWVRVPAERLDAMVERVLELTLQQGRLRSEMNDASSTALHHLEQSEFLLKESYAKLMELRLVPFDSVAQRLHQTVHQLTHELGKDVKLQIDGADVRLDRLVLEGLLDPLLHMVRNSLDHGIETPRQRLAAGKPRHGTIRVSLERVGDRVAISLRDDGRGIRVEELKRTAIELGLIDEIHAATISDEEALMLTTLPRFSTATRVSHVSGRGVGLDVVRDSLERLGGLIEIASKPGQGTELRLWVPLSLALVPSLLVRCVEELYAIPMAAIQRTLPLRDPSRDLQDGREYLEIDAGRIDLVRLDQRLGLRPAERQVDDAKVVLVHSGDRLAGIVVDDVVRRQDIVVKPFPSPMSQMRTYSGAALLENGAVALVLDPDHVVI